MANPDYPRPPNQGEHLEDRPFSLGIRNSPLEFFGGVLMSLAVAATHVWWTGHPLGQRVLLAPIVFPLQTLLPGLFCIWIYKRANRTNRPKTARLMLASAWVLAALALVSLGYALYTVSRVESAWLEERKMRAKTPV